MPTLSGKKQEDAQSQASRGPVLDSASQMKNSRDEA